ncbi:MAG: hypothetical protein AB1295_05590 [Candidatus Micrarchaeota archaeon]
MSDQMYIYECVAYTPSTGTIGAVVVTIKENSADVSRMLWKQGLQVSGGVKFKEMLGETPTRGLRVNNISHIISLTPKPGLSKPGTRPMEILLRSDGSRIRDGDLQKPPQALMAPPRQSMTMPRPIGGRRYP